MNNNKSSIKKEFSKISIPYYLPIKKKASILHGKLFLKHGLKNLSSTEHSSNSSINKSNQNNYQYNSFIFDLNSLNKEKNILPKIEKLSFNVKTPTYNFNYINCNSTKNITITKSNKLKIANLCNESNENNNCKIIKIIKNEKKNNFILNNSISKRKVSLDFSTCKKSGSEIIRKTNSFQMNKNNRKMLSNISPQQKLLINYFNSKNFLLNKIYGYSRAGTLNTGKPKINQDSFIILKNIFELNFDILGIMDGHGVNGQLVSQYLKKKIISIFAVKETYNLIKKNRNEIMENFIYHNLTKNNFTLIKNIINSIDKDLTKENFDSKSSGSTLLLLFHISKFIICANIGDSRCILIKKNYTLDNNNNTNNINNLKFENLSFDHKPNNEEEKKRIIENGGIVRQSLNYNGIYEGCYRIYMKEKNYPGLAISRTIGDFDSKLIGNISEPDIKMKVIDNNFICVVLASDGLWDVMHGNDVIKEIYPFFEKNNYEEIAENLVNKALFSWKAESFLRDDISTIVGIFNYKKKGKK